MKECTVCRGFKNWKDLFLLRTRLQTHAAVFSSWTHWHTQEGEREERRGGGGKEKLGGGGGGRGGLDAFLWGRWSSFARSGHIQNVKNTRVSVFVQTQTRAPTARSTAPNYIARWLASLIQLRHREEAFFQATSSSASRFKGDSSLSWLQHYIEN